MLGVLEHASRAALWLEALENKSSWTLILKLLEAIRRYESAHRTATVGVLVLIVGAVLSLLWTNRLV